MGICSGSDMYGDTRYGDLDPHTACQQVKQWLPAWASAAWARARPKAHVPEDIQQPGSHALHSLVLSELPRAA
eukprot:351108-Chlamydomonas_euryale.AAC.2